MKQHCKEAIVVYEGDCMETKDKVTKYAGIYNDLAELLGEEAVQIVYRNMAGQQITFPKRLYTKEYVVQETKNITSSVELKKEALKYGYTERRLKQLIKEENSC